MGSCRSIELPELELHRRSDIADETEWLIELGRNRREKPSKSNWRNSNLMRNERIVRRISHNWKFCFTNRFFNEMSSWVTRERSIDTFRHRWVRCYRNATVEKYGDCKRWDLVWIWRRRRPWLLKVPKLKHNKKKRASDIPIHLFG